MTRSWFLALALAATLFPTTIRAEEPGTPSAPDQQAIRGVIEAQLGAFRRDDGMAAFSYASPVIREKFGTPENFMAMVRGSYAAVYRPRQVEFRETRTMAGQTAQAVRFVGPDGKAVLAIYTMERQPDGGWRIGGVYLVEIAEAET